MSTIPHLCSFASDNYAGAMPEVMQAMQQANLGHAASYGADPLTKQVIEQIRLFFNAPHAEVFFVFNGTGANVLCLSTAAASHRSALVADVSHFYNDESSAPETFSGCRLFAVPANNEGKLEAAAVSSRLIRRGDVHYAQPALLSVTQSTEYGTLYSIDELRALRDVCREAGIYFHIDGSRLFNAIAALGCHPSEITTGAGVDLLSLGGTKAGMLFGEAVVVFNLQLAEAMRYKQKQVMQLASKTRFIAAQFGAMLSEDVWQRSAMHANAMAKRLGKGLEDIPDIRLTRTVQANAVFAIMPRTMIAPLQTLYPFYVWKEDTNEVRLMCGWDTREEDVDLFIEAAGRLAS